jgi:hypothetical protein
MLRTTACGFVTGKGARLDFPFSLQDITKALREVIRIFDDVAKRSGKVVKFYRSRGWKDAAKNLDYLRFPEGGIVKQLRLIAAGEFSETDTKELEEQLNATADGVGHAIATLTGYRNAIREQLSLETAIVLEQIINGENGKNNIRRLLFSITRDGRSDDERARKWVQVNAIRVLRKIDILNRNIIDLHDSLIEGKKAKKRKAKEVEPGDERPSKAKKKAAPRKRSVSAKAKS